MQRHCDLLREIQRVLCGWSRTVVSGGDRCSEWLEIKRTFEARSGWG